MYFPLRVGNGEYCSRWNDELYEFTVTLAWWSDKKQRMRWLGHVGLIIKSTPALNPLVEGEEEEYLNSVERVDVCARKEEEEWSTDI